MLGTLAIWRSLRTDIAYQSVPPLGTGSVAILPECRLPWALGTRAFLHAAELLERSSLLQRVSKVNGYCCSSDYRYRANSNLVKALILILPFSAMIVLCLDFPITAQPKNQEK
jgi:hypothetical protein